MNNGCAWNHSACRPGTKSLPHYLGDLGYRVGLAGKVHVLPNESFPFEKVAGFDSNCTRSPTETCSLENAKAFMSRDNKQPFCLTIALVEPHVPWVMGDASQFDKITVKLPDNIADTPKTREDFVSYLAEIAYMDQQVASILSMLRDTGLEENTLVVFTSEQGSQFPGNKWTCFDTGLHTAIIAKWPNRIAANTRSSAIVHYADILPTLLELAGGKPQSSMNLDGTSFAEVLSGKKDQHRDYAYATHNNFPEGTAFPIRSITDGKWRYIRNLTPDEIYIEKHLMGLLGGSSVHNAYWSSWLATASDSPRTYNLVRRYMRRPSEELYHTEVDPYEMNNRIDATETKAIKDRLATELDRWLQEQGDQGKDQDTEETFKAAKSGMHKYFPAR
jgi:N-sulfoglucosamine sulfohydrolase